MFTHLTYGQTRTLASTKHDTDISETATNHGGSCAAPCTHTELSRGRPAKTSFQCDGGYFDSKVTTVMHDVLVSMAGVNYMFYKGECSHRRSFSIKDLFYVGNKINSCLSHLTA